MKRRLLPFLLLLLAAGHPLGCGSTSDSPPREPDAPLGSQSQAVGGVPTGALSTNRTDFSLVTLTDGRILVVGGSASSGQTASCELYNPATGTWSPTGSLSQPRTSPALEVLPDGRVLMAGGTSSNTATSGAELYDPATGTWSPAPSMPMSLFTARSAVLTGGRVLVVGNRSTSAAIFDPSTQTWSAVITRPTSSWMEMTSLADGRVVAVGSGYAEIFNPATSTWSSSSWSTLVDRIGHTVTALADGRVLIAGGYDASGTYLATAALYDPATNTFSATPGSMSVPRISHRTWRLPDGKVLLLGGKSGPSLLLDIVEHFDPATGTFSSRAKLAAPRTAYRLAALANGRLLLAGGTADSPSVPNSELYNPEDCYTSCAQLNKNCGAVSDACGGTLQCGTCGGGLTCNANVCGDITAPVATFTAPRTDVFLHNTVTVSVTATDAVGAVRAELTTDTGPVGTLQGPGPYTWSWNTRSNYATRLTVRVYDAAGNVGTAIRNVQVFNGYANTAAYDTTYRVPRCSTYDSASCDSGSLLTGRAALGPEVNTPNTLQAGCPDGTSGSFHVDESLDRLMVSTLDNTPIGQGKTVRVDATVWASSSWSSDELRLFSATDVPMYGTPTWNLVATLKPTGPGAQVLSTTIVLPAGSDQAIRGLFFRGSSAWWCSPTGSYDDRDDLMFTAYPLPDPDAPTVALTSPAGGATLTQTVTLQASASDNFGVSRVEFYADGQLLGRATAAPFSYAWSTLSLANGSHTLTARAYDVSGNSTTSAPVQVLLENDKVPPAVAITSPASGATVSGNMSVLVTASDNEAVRHVRLLVDGQQVYSYTDYTITSASLPWNTRSVANGSHTLTVTATDLSENTTTSQAVQVLVDNDVTAPSVSLTSPASGATLTGTVTLAVDVSDNVGVTQVEYYAGATRVAFSTAAPFQAAFNSSTLANGAYVLTAKASDAAGNVATSAAVPVSLSNAGSPGNALYDATLKAPGCGTPGISCDSVTLVDGRAGLGPEVNTPNTLNGSCLDGTTGTYHVSQSLDRLKVSTLDGTPLAEGKTVRIEATVWVSASSSDRLDLYTTQDVSNPSWTLLGTLAPTANGLQTLSKTYVLPQGTRQAVRGSFRSGGTPSPCASDTRGDRDDLVFAVTQEADTVAPTVALTSPVSGASLTGSVTVTASASDNFGVKQVDVYANGTLLGTVTEAPYSVSWNTLGVENGVYTLTAVASDVAGNTSTSQATQVTVDNDKTAPTVSITSPIEGATLSGAVSFAASASDNVGVSRVELYVDGTPAGSDSSAPFAFTWLSGTWANGAHTLTAKAFDAAGNVGTSASVQVVLDNDKTAPTVSITSPTEGATLSNTVWVTASASDASGISRVDFYVDGAFRVGDVAAPYEFSWSTTALTNGSHTLTAKAYDSNNNVGTSTTVSVTLNNDKTAPTVSLTSPTSGATVSGTVTLAATASDNVGVTRVEFYVGGTLYTSVAGAPFQSTWNSTSVVNGSYVFQARAYDAAGNSASSSSVSVTVANGGGNTLPYSASNTNSAQQNTVNQTLALTAGQTLTLGTCGVTGSSFSGDTYLRLYNPSGTQVAVSDDACGGAGSNFTYTVPAGAGGNYQLRAGCYSSNSCSGTVAWTTTGGSNPPPSGGNTLTYNAANTNSAQQSTVNQTIALVQGQTLTLGTCGVTGATFTGDTYLRLYNSSGTQVAYNDDACGGGGSNFTYTVPTGAGGNYQLRAGCYSSGSCSGTVAWTIQ